MRLAAVALLLLAGPALAQPSGSTILAGGGPGGDLGDAIAVAPYTGHTAVVGTFEQTATFGPGVSVTSADAPAARSDAFVVFYAPDGTALWARRMGTSVFNDFGGGVALAPSFFAPPNAIYVSGYFTGIATFDGGANPDASLTTRNDFDAFLAAYSFDGDLLWVTQSGGPEQDTGRGLAVSPFGSVIQTGSFTGTAMWGSGDDAVTRTSAGGSDGFLAMYAPDGRLTSVTTVGGPESDDLRAAAHVSPTLSFDGLYATGTFRSVAMFGTIPLSSRGQSDVAVIQVRTLNPTGEDPTVLWASQIGGNGFDYARGLAVSDGGQIAVAGSFENTLLVGTDALTSAGASDAFLAVLDHRGVALGGHRGGGAGFDIANAVAATTRIDTPTARGGSDPAFAVSGYLDGESTFGSTPVAGQGTDAFVAIYLSTLSGATLSDVFAIGGSGTDRAYGVAIGAIVDDASPGYDFPMRVTGSFRESVTVGTTTVTSSGDGDVFVATVPLCPTFTCPVLVAGDADPTPGVHLNASPNPSPSRLSLTLASPADATIEIVDALGRVVARLHAGPLPAGETSWATPRLSPGAYWLVARTGGAVHRQGVTVAR